MAVAWRVSEPEEADQICLTGSSLAEVEVAVVVTEDMEIRFEYEYGREGVDMQCALRRLSRIFSRTG
jgi:hypothetical protein